jgi:transposase
MAHVRLLTTLAVSDDHFFPHISLILSRFVGILKVRYKYVIKDLTIFPPSSIIILSGRGPMNDRKQKRQVLKQARALNAHPERVRSPLFADHPFFDPEDKAQVKYEMLRVREVEGASLTEACRLYGFTRESYRHILARFRQEGIGGLFERKRGRRGPLKATDRVREFIHAERRRQAELSAEDLIERCREELGVVLSRRTVFRILEAEEGSKKKPNPKRRDGR